MANSDLYLKGLEVRRAVLGDAYVAANLAAGDDFMMPFQRRVTELAWGHAWQGTALDRKTKCLLTIGLLAALGRFQEVGIYTKGAIYCRLLWPAVAARAATRRRYADRSGAEWRCNVCDRLPVARPLGCTDAAHGVAGWWHREGNMIFCAAWACRPGATSPSPAEPAGAA
jgi:hypothetical protein